MPDNELFFRGNRTNFVDILKTGKDLGFLVYVVTVKDLILSGPRILGYSYSSEDQIWHPQWFPLPNVIYNRIPQRSDEMRPEVKKKLEECINHPSIQLFNPFFFNKWTLFEWLKKSNSTHHLVPLTKRLRSSTTIEKMLTSHSYLYLKPESGKAGKGIMMIKYQTDRKMPYRLKIQNHKNSTTYETARVTKLWSRIKKEAGSSPYIIQQGIELSSIQNRPFDLRVLVQKNVRGRWGVTGVGARQAGKSSITTHVPRGGSIEDPEKLLNTLFGQDTMRTIMNRVKSNSLLIAYQIEKAAGYPLGEMSIDLGVDGEGDIWFFEANSKPMKFDEPQIRKRSLERIFQYCQFLAMNKKTNSV
nr:YheC/YheD family protein [Paenibacillus sediminis]